MRKLKTGTAFRSPHNNELYMIVADRINLANIVNNDGIIIGEWAEIKDPDDITISEFNEIIEDITVELPDDIVVTGDEGYTKAGERFYLEGNFYILAQCAENLCCLINAGTGLMFGVYGTHVKDLENISVTEFGKISRRQPFKKVFEK